MNLDPLRYNERDDNKKVDITDGKSRSPYFLYAQVEHGDGSPYAEDEATILKKTAWADEFLKDDENDYFIVDPNNGVLTTGGVIARYGKIGDWVISESGLYQRYTPTDTLASKYENRYMYLGHPGMERDEIKNLRIAYDAQIESLKK